MARVKIVAEILSRLFFAGFEWSHVLYHAAQRELQRDCQTNGRIAHPQAIHKPADCAVSNRVGNKMHGTVSFYRQTEQLCSRSREADFP